MFVIQKDSISRAIAQGFVMNHRQNEAYILILIRAATIFVPNDPRQIAPPVVRVVRTPRGEDEPSW